MCCVETSSEESPSRDGSPLYALFLKFIIGVRRASGIYSPEVANARMYQALQFDAEPQLAYTGAASLSDTAHHHFVLIDFFASHEMHPCTVLKAPKLSSSIVSEHDC